MRIEHNGTIHLIKLKSITNKLTKRTYCNDLATLTFYNYKNLNCLNFIHNNAYFQIYIES